MPPLVMDEVLLLVDTYFQLKHIHDKQEIFDVVENLSQRMKELPFFPEQRANPSFRSHAGMDMCLSNVSSLKSDENNLSHYSKLQKIVYEYYENRQDELHLISKTISRVASGSFPLDFAFSKNIYGIIIPSFHLYMERCNSIVQTVRDEMITLGRLTCEICGRDLEREYFDASELLEMHIDLPLSSYRLNMSVSPSDLVCICPNCHKLAHLKYENLNTKELIKKVRI